jgi:hypothetical protein
MLRRANFVNFVGSAGYVNVVTAFQRRRGMAKRGLGVLHRGAPPHKCRRFEKRFYLKDFCAAEIEWRRGRDSHPLCL